MNTSLTEFLRKLGAASLISAIIIPLTILLFQIIIVRVGLDGYGISAVWWALIGTPIVYIGIPWLIVAAFALFISAAPSGRKPLETVTAYTMTLVMVGMYMTLVNTFAMFVLGAVASRLSHLPGFLGLATAASIALGVWAMVFKAPSKWLAQLSLWTFIAVIFIAIIEFISPGSMRSFISATSVSPTVMRYNEQVAQTEERFVEQLRAQVALRGKTVCNMTNPETWPVKQVIKPGECAITPKELRVWNEGKNHVLKNSMDAVREIFSGRDAGEKTGSATERAARKKIVRPAGCRVDKEVSVAGDEVFISFPNCWAGPWETDLPGSLNWTCDFDRDVKIAWKFGGNRKLSIPATGMPGAGNGGGTLSYPLKKTSPFGLEINNNKMEWNLVPTIPDPESFWDDQKDLVLIRCSAML